jgi:hypothetical protein
MADDALSAPCHFERCAPGECQEKNTRGVGARQHEMRNAVRERVGLAGSCAGDDEQWSRPELRGLLLPLVQTLESGRLKHLR